MKLNKIGQVWNSANRLLSDFIGLLSSKNFATMATWRKHFSSLSYGSLFYMQISRGLRRVLCCQCSWGSPGCKSESAYVPEGANSIWIRIRVDVEIFESAKKNLRIQKYPDTYNLYWKRSVCMQVEIIQKQFLTWLRLHSLLHQM